jgi:hypothetical protein
MAFLSFTATTGPDGGTILHIAFTGRGPAAVSDV